jgi:fructokinase
VRTPRDDYDGTLAAIAGLVHGLEVRFGGPARVGVGMPGSLSPRTGLVRNANSTWLNGRSLGADLETRLGRPVRLENDANCFTLSEATDGAGAGARVVFGVILGTGVGGGVVVDGRVLTGANAVAGEWGHNPLPGARGAEVPGPACYCGRRGCIETFCSGPALRADHGEALPDAEAVVAAAEKGDAAARAALDRYEDRLARALGSVINLLDPDVVVLGGGLSNVARLYVEVPPRLPAYVFSDVVHTRLVPPLHGDSSGVRGAAWLWPE